MNLIAQLLAPGNVLVGLEVGSKKRMFEQVAMLFEQNQGLPHSLVFDSLFAREKLGSTGLGEGVAIPHGRVKALPEAMGALVKMQTPIDFDAPDGVPVGLVFVLLVPEKATDLHLQILSELAQMFSDLDLRNKLAASSDAAEIHRLISEWSPHAAGQHSAAG